MRRKPMYPAQPFLGEQPTITSAPVSVTTSMKIVAVPTYKVSGHYVDAKIKDVPRKGTYQLTLWDALLPETKAGDVTRFEDYKEEIVVQALRLTTREDNTMSAIMRVLKKKSNAGDYMGNLPAEVVIYGGREQKAPKMGVTLHELATETYGKDYSGRDLELLREALTGLAEKRRLISYRRRNSNGKYDIIEEYQPLIKLYGLYRDVEEIETKDGSYREKGELALCINPLLVDQIDSKFIEYPEDIDRRTMIAAQALNGRYPEAVNTLRDYLIRFITSNTGDTTEINAENLPYKLGLEKYIHEGRRKLIQKTTDKAFMAVKALGIVTKIEKVRGAIGQEKYVFHLNREWR